MDTQITKASAHPLVIVAAISVTLVSLVGTGMMLGWIPTSTGSPAPGAAVPPLAQAPAQPEAVQQTHAPHPKPKHAMKSEPLHPAPQAGVVPTPPPPVQMAAVCKECGVIEDVREVEKAGQGSGVGAVGGAVVGGVLGHQVGAGRGRDVATVLGALGGGIAGNQIEKTVKKTKEYQIWVRYEGGSKGMFVQATPPGWRVGDKVRVVNGQIQSNG
jgi:outer membrane lipoprotein SlyB